MPRLYPTTPMLRLLPLPSRRWDPRGAFASATERARAGTLSPEDAHHLFDELLLQANPVPERSLNGFLAALARAPSSAALRDGPSLALGLFNRVCREEAGPRVVPPTVCTYNILMDSCCRARRPDLGLAFFDRFLRMGLKADQIVANNLLKCLCHARRTHEAINVLLHRMSEFGCVPNVISYSIVLKSLCDDSRSQQAFDLLQMVRKEGGAGSLNVVAYSTVIHAFFKEGEASKACDLFHEMMQQGIVPNVVTYSSIIDALCKVRAMDKAKLVLQQMVDNGVRPNMYTWNSFMYSLCKNGRSKEAAEFFDSMTPKGLKPNIVVYSTLLHGYASE
ncbi:hypothetical protein CFC21_000823 [Triticum aestivum]|uniref:Pentacotripeptide-repeat region of PRORP domain-containing protein n=1 Tax=Triticum aestivum TaxID=4565 RepID=A0A3B5XWB9_WHEAT|nr:hypothetical protein CFC21_000823 [Triticum aestivum]